MTMTRYNLRPRAPKVRRTDPVLCEIFDALPPDLLRMIVLYTHVMPRHRYNTRLSARLVVGNAVPGPAMQNGVM